MPFEISCKECGKSFTVGKSRSETAKFCSRYCSDNHPRIKNISNCVNCGKPFPIKKSQSDRSGWNCCSEYCRKSHRSKSYSGINNPNYKGKNVDHDGYRLFIPEAKGVRVKLHRHNAAIALGLNRVPIGFHVHHRDCNILNNEPENLALMTVSDHNWLHKQFGNATLWAFMNNKVSINELKSWSDNPDRAEKLLITDVYSQGMSIISGEKHFAMDVHQSIASLYPVRAEFIEVDELSETKRGANGMGSTGK
jgi:hypothetical protein